MFPNQSSRLPPSPDKQQRAQQFLAHPPLKPRPRRQFLPPGSKAATMLCLSVIGKWRKQYKWRIGALCEQPQIIRRWMVTFNLRDLIISSKGIRKALLKLLLNYYTLLEFSCEFLSNHHPHFLFEHFHNPIAADLHL